MMSKNPTTPPTTGRAKTSTPGKNPTRIDAIGAAMRALTTITGSEFAERFGLRQTVDRVTYEEAIQQDLKVVDAAAFSLCRENELPMVVFGMEGDGNITRALQGERIGTLVVPA